jgi:hypothetical protein
VPGGRSGVVPALNFNAGGQGARIP